MYNLQLSYKCHCPFGRDGHHGHHGQNGRKGNHGPDGNHGRVGHHGRDRPLREWVWKV